jgi:hypothetical protein|tara:strand:- start:245 stop:421 length:177 start_codon:yes stop_codon:yes gene_type:complete
MSFTYKPGFTVQGPKKKKKKKEKAPPSFMNPKAAYYKFVQPTGFNAMMKKKKKKQLQA